MFAASGFAVYGGTFVQRQFRVGRQLERFSGADQIRAFPGAVKIPPRLEKTEMDKQLLFGRLLASNIEILAKTSKRGYHSQIGFNQF